MKGRTHKERLAELRTMYRTRLQDHPDQERTVGARLAACLPKIIEAERAKCGRVRR